MKKTIIQIMEAFRALLGELSCEEIMTNSELIRQAEKVEGILRGMTLKGDFA